MKKLVAILIIAVIVIGLIYMVDNINEVRIAVKDGYIHASILEPANNTEGVITVIVAGSGPTDRDGNTPIISGRNDSLKYLAYSLQDRNIAVLRYDKRTSGRSRESFDNSNISIDSFVDDLVACIRNIKEQKKYKKIYLVGHSQGSLISILAAQKETVDGVVSIAGTARPIDEIVVEQLQRQDANMAKEARDILVGIREGRIEESLEENESIQSDEFKDMFSLENREFLKTWMKYDPAVEIRKLEIPIYFIYGTSDIQVEPVEINFFGDIIKEENSIIIEDMNHVLKLSPKDLKENMKRYLDPSYPLHIELAKSIAGFIEQGRSSEKL